MNDDPDPLKAAHSVDDLLKFNDDDFVQCAYLSILGRSVDAEGLENYVQHIRAGADRLALIHSLATSPEGSLLDPSRLPGLKEALQNFGRHKPSYISRRIAGLVTQSLRPLFARMDVCEYRIGKLEKLIHLRSDALESSLKAVMQNIRSAGVINDDELAKLEQLTAHARSIYFQLKYREKDATGTPMS